jgi:hypothetical protein
MGSAVTNEGNPLEPWVRLAQASGTARFRAAVLVLCGLASLPVAVLADAPVANPIVRATPAVSATDPPSVTGSGPAGDSAGDWDGLVTLVVSYLEATSNANVTVAFTEPAT